MTFGCGTDNCYCGDAGYLLGPTTTVNGLFLYALSRYDGDPQTCQNGGTSKVLTGGQVRESSGGAGQVLGSAPGATAIAGAGFQFAQLPLVPGGPAQPDIEVWSTGGGPAGVTIHPGGTVRHLSMCAEGVIAQVAGAGGSSTLHLYSAHSGAVLGSRYLNPGAKLVNASGARVLYLLHGRSIRIWNLKTGQIHPVYTTGLPPASIHLDGRRIVWHTGGEFNPRDAIRVITLPRLPT